MNKSLNQSPIHQKGPGKTILIVDDDPVNAKIISYQLESHGFTTRVCPSGEECLEILKRHSFALLLMDILMPGMNGLEVLTRIRRKFPPVELPVIMVTSIEDKEKVVEALDMGASDYLTKPMNIDVAVARINSLLTAAAYHQERLRCQRSEAIRAMIKTYNHEINNPMTVAMLGVKTAIRQQDTSHLERVYDALLRIDNIVKKIQELTVSEIEIGDHLGDTMVKLPPSQ